MGFINSIIIITGILDFILSFLVLLRNNKSQINISFAIFSFFLGTWAFSIAFFRIVDDPTFSLFWAKMIYISGSCIAASLFYFALVFPSGKKISNKMKAMIIVPSVIHAVLIMIPSYLTREIVYRSWGKEVILGSSEYIVYSLYFLFFFYGALYILHSKLKSSTSRVRNQIFFILTSILIAGIIASIFDLFLPWFGNYELIYVGPMFSGIIFWLVTYAIVKHQLWDFRLVVARSIAYTILLLWLGSIYTLGVFWTSRFLLKDELQSNQILIYTVLALFVAITFQPLKSYLERATDKIFFKYNYDSNELLSLLSNIMATTIHLDNLTHNTLHALTKTLHISHGSFHVYQDGKLIQFATEGVVHIMKEEHMAKLSAMKRTLLYDEETSEQIKTVMREANVSFFQPLHVKERTIGFLILGDKKSGELYSKKDIDVLTIFGPQIAISIENAQAYEEIKRFNITLKDEVEKATTNLKHANERLKELDRMKDEFVSLASHELRTPMTAIKSYVWMLLEHNMVKDKKGKEYLEHTYQATDRLINLVNDMLNVSRIESGRMTISLSAVNLQELISQVVAEVKPSADKQKLSLKTQIEPGAKLMVQADANKIKQVLVNLIGNAIKFTPSGGTITITAVTEGEYIKTSVADSGKGLMKEDMPKLFKKFGMLEKNYTSKPTTQGTGLGLYISKSIIEKHNGKITVESEGKDKGATFSFTLQVA